MSGWLPDQTVAHLRNVTDWPDLGERYAITGRVGHGGTSTVYVAHDRTLDREVVVKVVDPDIAGGSAAERLGREARVLAGLEHPGIVPVHDAGALADGRVFSVMKLVRGRRLDEELASRVSLADRLSIVARICDTVSFAHARGVVHRDLKPENIMIGPFGEVLVLDWGVATSASDAAGGPLIAGTPGYMAPEQARGDSAPEDARADVFSLGALLRHVVPEPGPAPLRAIADRAMAPDPGDRYPTVAAFAAELARFRDGQRVLAHRESLAERAGRVYDRYRIPILLVLAYALMRVLLILYTAGR